MEIILILGALVASPFVLKVLDKPTRNRVVAIGRSTRKAGKDLDLPTPAKRDRSSELSYHKLWDDAFKWLTLSDVAVDYYREQEWRGVSDRSWKRTRERWVRDSRPTPLSHMASYYNNPEVYDSLRKEEAEENAKFNRDILAAREVDEKYALMVKYGIGLYKNDVMAIASIKD